VVGKLNENGRRAIGSAFAASRAALVVFHHRIVGRSETLGDYRWGLDTKEARLEIAGAQRPQRANP
jgi:O6-methylguanine-DNA--protein-cysteine methyltransferase